MKKLCRLASVCVAEMVSISIRQEGAVLGYCLQGDADAPAAQLGEQKQTVQGKYLLSKHLSSIIA